MAKSSTFCTAMLIAGMLATGTLNTLTTKIQFTLYSRDSTGDYVKFSKPWFGTLNMLFAMLLVGIIDKLLRLATSKPSMTVDESEKNVKMVTQPLIGGDQPVPYTRKVLLVAWPAFFDLLATACGCIGILYIPASVWQMLRGACIIFSGIFSITFLGRTFAGYNWAGLGLCVVGVCVVGLASVLSADVASQTHQTPAAAEVPTSLVMFGMVMVLLGQVVQAAQVIAEEWLMKDVDLPAMQIIGYEGLWGTLMMLVVVYPMLYVIPGRDHGCMEDAYDTYVMLANSPGLVKCMVTYLFSCATFNATGIAVTQELSAVHRMMLDASRTTVIWAFGLMVHIYQPESEFGEVWTCYSPLQLFGFLILVLGQAVYGQVVRLPGLRYPPPMASPRGSPSFASPSQGLNLLPDLPPARKDVDLTKFASPGPMSPGGKQV